MSKVLVFDNDCSFRSRILGAGSLGDSVLLVPRDFWFGVIWGAGLGGFVVLVGALGWYPSAWGLMGGRGTVAIWGFPARNIYLNTVR